MSRAPTVLVADDHPASRLGVSIALRSGGFDVVAEVGDGPQAVRAAVLLRPDLCLLDVRMPGGGIEAAAEIVGAVPGALVIMLTVSDTEEDVFRALRVGAVGYLLKDMSSDRLAAALRGVLKGEVALPRSVTSVVVAEFRRLAAAADGGQSTGPAGLSRREWEILLLLRADLSTAAIAARLLLSPVTVRRHISAAMAKLGVGSRGDAVRKAQELARGAAPVAQRGSDQPGADARDRGLDAAVGPELLDDVGNVLLRRIGTDVQRTPDCIVAAAGGDQAQHL